MDSLRINKELNSGSAAVVNHLQVPTQRGEENSFKRGEREVGQSIANRVHWGFESL